MQPLSLVIHGGAGTIRPEDLTPALEAAYKLGLQNALNAGYEVLKRNGTSVDAVIAAVVSLEDCIYFNAGRGAVFAKDGSQEMDASIMEGKERKAGAVAAVKNIKNPVLLANAVMRHSEHVMMMGRGAEAFARLHKVETMPDEYFYSEFRYKQWQQVQATSRVALDHNISITDKKFGTVGAVALDAYGNMAAATSTGGMTNKEFGRVGDSPIIGAGTYANNNTCAISCTGHGEPFIKAVTAYDVSCLMEYKGCTLEEAMHTVVNDKLLQLEGEGGMIGVDAKGNAGMVFNSEGMYRGIRTANGRNEVAIYK
jgi:beta-aspartyl-peptidase (threonine type)